jgi:hypothetical protein
MKNKLEGPKVSYKWYIRIVFFTCICFLLLHRKIRTKGKKTMQIPSSLLCAY